MTTVDYTYEVGDMPTVEEVTNLYLYGQKEKPENLLDPSTWANYGDEVVVELDYATALNLMTSCINPADFSLVQKFMGDNGVKIDNVTPVKIDANGNKYYTKDQLI